MGAYATFYPGTCQVKTSVGYVAGASFYVPSASPGSNWNVCLWNAVYGPQGYGITVATIPAACNCGPTGTGYAPPPPPPPPPPATPPGATVPPPAPPQSTVPQPVQTPGGGAKGPVTGPGPKPDPCAPAMAQRLDHGDLGFYTAEHLRMTGGGHFTGGRVGARHVGAADEPPLTGEPEYTRPPRVKVKGNPRTGAVTTFEHGTGPGWVAFHSPDLNEFSLRGDGVHPKGEWPARQSKQTLLIHSGEATGSKDHADNILAIGLPSARTHRPRSGVYLRRDNDGLHHLLMPFTDSDGVDAERSDLRNLIVNGTPMVQIRYHDFTAADIAAVGTDTAALAIPTGLLPAKTEVLAVAVEIISALDGGGITSVLASVGDGSTADRYQTGTSELHVTGGASDGDMQYSPQAVPDFAVGTIPLTVTFQATGGDLADLSAGTIRVWWKVQVWE